MLNVLRESFRNQPYLRIVLLVVAVSFVLALAGVGYQSCGTQASTDWVARVNGRPIPEQRFVATARRIDQYFRDMLGASYEQARPSLRIPQQAIEGLIDQEVVRQDAERLGLTSSAEELAEHIRTDPSFADSSGQFVGAERYRQAVQRSVPGGVAAFERDIAEGLIAAKWTSLVTQSVTVSDEELERVFRRRTVKTAVDYVVFASSEQTTGGTIDDAAARAWYDAHQDDFQRAAGWKVRYVIVEREAQRAAVQVTPEQVREYYDANRARYEHPEQRRARHILFRVEASAGEQERAAARQAAEKALKRLEAGEDFAPLARELSDDTLSAENGGDLGFFGRGQMVPQFEQAVFSTNVGELAPLTESPFGFHVIEVTDSRPAGVAPLEEVEESIRRTLELQAAQQLAESEAQRLAGEMVDAAGLQAVADRVGLAVTARNVTQDDRLQDLGVSPDFMAALSAMQPGELSAPLRVAAGMALVALDDLLPAAVAPLDEVRDEVEQAIRDDRARQAAVAGAERAVERYASVEAAAKALQLEARESGDLTPDSRGLPGSGGAVPEIEQLLADGVQVGDRGVLEVPAGAIYYEVTARTPFERERFDEQEASLRAELLSQRRQQYRQAVIERLRAQQQIEINFPKLQQYS